MIEEETTTVAIGELYGQKKVPNITILNGKFWGRPNFAGEIDRFKSNSRKFTLLLPFEAADTLKALGYNVKIQIGTTVTNGTETKKDWQRFETYAEIAGVALAENQELICSIKVMVDMSEEKDLQNKGSKVFMRMGEEVEQLNSRTAGLIDRSRILSFDCEFRGWEYDAEEDPGKYSARLVECVAVVEPNLIQQRHGRLG